MKVFIALLSAAVIMMFPLGAKPAQAATDGRTYARADMRNVYFCSAMDENTALFALPYTYCVEIISEQGEWYLVRYAQDDGFYKAVTGYCKGDGLTIIDELPQNLYLNFPVTATLKSPVPQDGSLPGLETEVTAAYYGVYYKGAAAYSYVLYNGMFRYIAGANEDYPLNEIPAEPTFEPTEPEQFSGNAKLVTALIVTGIAAAAIVILMLAGRRKPAKK